MLLPESNEFIFHASLDLESDALGSINLLAHMNIDLSSHCVTCFIIWQISLYVNLSKLELAFDGGKDLLLGQY